MLTSHNETPAFDAAAVVRVGTLGDVYRTNRLSRQRFISSIDSDIIPTSFPESDCTSSSIVENRFCACRVYTYTRVADGFRRKHVSGVAGDPQVGREFRIIRSPVFGKINRSYIAGTAGGKNRRDAGPYYVTSTARLVRTVEKTLRVVFENIEKKFDPARATHRDFTAIIICVHYY